MGITHSELQEWLADYDSDAVTIGVIASHSSLIQLPYNPFGQGSMQLLKRRIQNLLQELSLLYFYFV